MIKSWLIMVNEVRLYLQDRGELAFSLLLPIVTFALMYGAFGGDTLFESTARIVDEDGGVYAERIIEQLDSVDGISIERLTAEEADSRLERSDLLLAMFIPAGFSDSLESNGKAELYFKQRGNGGQEGQILASIIGGVVQDINRELQARAQVASIVGEFGITRGVDVVVDEKLAEQRTDPTVGIKEDAVGGSPDFINLFLPGIVTMYVLFSLTLSARTIVEERRRGTLERLLTTSLSVGEMFTGKFLASVGRAFVQTLILLGLAYIVFSHVFSPLSFLASLLIILVYAAAASAIGLLIASISRSEDGAVWIGVVFTMAMVMLGGTFFEVAPDSILHTLGRFSINTYANEAVRAIIAEGGGLGDVLMDLGILAAVALVGLFISRLLFKVVPGVR